ncbi:hypothetical protein [Clostridium magnum]|uniref:Uncharacterized protein n=1 Tax=Clostridium magnum DSM 2767 TaxID=1121326 RepID=A0A161WZE2_9CLOT|nr:hypothetical protein [Clostridium magnum]KZL92518.1 hypothetical protein CLMAG_23270 [Clostridium magnum DSM 2767]SHI22852.1 hypothetical protein SAMN02745944_03386 [Clostridium magnum DSM 2767]
MSNKTMSINENKLVEDRLELNFKDAINYFKASVKGVISAIINDDTNNIIILKNNEKLEIKDLSIFKIEFIRDVENCILAKVKYCASEKNSIA